MTQCDLNKVIAGSTTGRAEVMAAIDGLAEEVARLALHVRRIVAIADARPKRSATCKRSKWRKRRTSRYRHSKTAVQVMLAEVKWA
jgi:hypothetical protein